MESSDYQNNKESVWIEEAANRLAEILIKQIELDYKNNASKTTNNTD
ncbi:MAG: hypothetical protein WC938_00380 [Candidatus Paceibacterota bacterium]|jgi:hypothetical protein